MTQSYNNASTSSTSSLSGSFPDTEDDQTIASILTEEEKSQVVKKLGSRLSHLDSIPHAPRVNREIPDINDATLDHERLSRRLAAYGLAELQIAGDGNCQFRALSDQLFRNPNHHKHVRKEVMKQLKHFRKFYESYVPMKYNSYLKQMKKSGEWGDHVTLQAAADRFHADQGDNSSHIFVYITTDLINALVGACLKPKFAWSRLFARHATSRLCPITRILSEVWLSFWSEVHYNSLYAIEDVPTKVPRKRHWLF